MSMSSSTDGRLASYLARLRLHGGNSNGGGNRTSRYNDDRGRGRTNRAPTHHEYAPITSKHRTDGYDDPAPHGHSHTGRSRRSQAPPPPSYHQGRSTERHGRNVSGMRTISTVHPDDSISVRVSRFFCRQRATSEHRGRSRAPTHESIVTSRQEGRSRSRAPAQESIVTSHEEGRGRSRAPTHQVNGVSRHGQDTRGRSKGRAHEYCQPSSRTDHRGATFHHTSHDHERRPRSSHASRHTRQRSPSITHYFPNDTSGATHTYHPPTPQPRATSTLHSSRYRRETSPASITHRFAEVDPDDYIINPNYRRGRSLSRYSHTRVRLWSTVRGEVVRSAYTCGFGPYAHFSNEPVR